MVSRVQNMFPVEPFKKLKRDVSMKPMVTPLALLVSDKL